MMARSAGQQCFSVHKVLFFLPRWTQDGPQSVSKSGDQSAVRLMNCNAIFSLVFEFSWRPYFSGRILDVMFTLFPCTHTHTHTLTHIRPHGGAWIYSYWVLFTFWDTCKCFKFVDRPDGNTFLLQLLTVKVSDNLCFYVSSRSVDLLISSCNLWYFYARLVWNCYYRALFDCHYWTAALLSLANCCFAVDIFIVLMLMLLLLLFYNYYYYYYYYYYYHHYYHCCHYYHFIVISYLLFIFIVIFILNFAAA